MKSNERNQGPQFERQPNVDLQEWREQLVEYVNSRLGVTEEELRRYLGYTLAPDKYEAVMNTVLADLVCARLAHTQPQVQSGDIVSVGGGIVYDVYTQSDHEFDAGWLDQGSQIRGVFNTLWVKDYLAEEILDIDAGDITEELVREHIRHYGVHMVLAYPVEVGADGHEHEIPDCEALFVPLMYDRLELVGYLARSN